MGVSITRKLSGGYKRERQKAPVFEVRCRERTPSKLDRECLDRDCVEVKHLYYEGFFLNKPVNEKPAPPQFVNDDPQGPAHPNDKDDESAVCPQQQQ